MDLLHFLKIRLRFIEQLYDGAASPFVEIKRQIDAGEPPYVDNRDPEYCDGEPAFLSEWEQASDSVNVIGYWCLCAGAGVAPSISQGIHRPERYLLVES